MGGNLVVEELVVSNSKVLIVFQGYYVRMPVAECHIVIQDLLLGVAMRDWCSLISLIGTGAI